jgi:Ca2+-binding EF-hand superfamily protein
MFWGSANRREIDARSDVLRDTETLFEFIDKDGDGYITAVEVRARRGG